MRRTRAFTLIELLVGLALVSLVLSVSYGFLHLMFAGQSRFNLAALMRRSFIQKDTKNGVRQLIYRLRESIQILSPAPGATASELVFRDLNNNDIRLRQIPRENRVITEISRNGTWVQETGPSVVHTKTGAVAVSWPVVITNCSSIHFSVLAGDCVSIVAAIEWEGQVGSLLMVVKLRNASQAY